MFVLDGRRRVGKTALLTHWLETIKHPALYLMANRTSAAAQLHSFQATAQSYLNPDQPVAADFTDGTWQKAFCEVTRLATELLVVVIEELADRDRSVTPQRSAACMGPSAQI
jgi:hypothetical protein